VLDDDGSNDESGCSHTQKNKCFTCEEGCIFGENVYCNLKGGFYPIDNNDDCKHYFSKQG